MRASWQLLGVGALLACGSSTTAAPDDAHKGAQEGDGKGGAGGDAPVFAGPDLFACGLTVDCLQEGGHMGSYLPGELACGGKLVVSGRPGVVLRLLQPGPCGRPHETLALLLGDGTAYVQQRAKLCASLDPSPPWSYSALERCAVVEDPTALSGCAQSGEPCAWSPSDVTSCARVSESWQCPATP